MNMMEDDDDISDIDNDKQQQQKVNSLTGSPENKISSGDHNDILNLSPSPSPTLSILDDKSF